MELIRHRCFDASVGVAGSMAVPALSRQGSLSPAVLVSRRGMSAADSAAILSAHITPRGAAESFATFDACTPRGTAPATVLSARAARGGASGSGTLVRTPSEFEGATGIPSPRDLTEALGSGRRLRERLDKSVSPKLALQSMSPLEQSGCTIDHLTRAVQAEARAERAETDLARLRLSLDEAQQRHRDATQLLQRLSDANAVMRAKLDQERTRCTPRPASETEALDTGAAARAALLERQLVEERAKAERWRRQYCELEQHSARQDAASHVLTPRPAELEAAEVQGLRHRVWVLERDLQECRQVLAQSQAEVERARERRPEKVLAASESTDTRFSSSERALATDVHHLEGDLARVRAELRHERAKRVEDEHQSAACAALRDELGQFVRASNTWEAAASAKLRMFRQEVESSRQAEAEASTNARVARDRLAIVVQEESRTMSSSSAQARDEVCALEDESRFLRENERCLASELAQSEQLCRESSARAVRWRSACNELQEELLDAVAECSAEHAEASALRIRLADQPRLAPSPTAAPRVAAAAASAAAAAVAAAAVGPAEAFRCSVPPPPWVPRRRRRHTALPITGSQSRGEDGSFADACAVDILVESRLRSKVCEPRADVAIAWQRLHEPDMACGEAPHVVPTSTLRAEEDADFDQDLFSASSLLSELCYGEELTLSAGSAAESNSG